jgi:glycosyltransferase involved in cell wall biosynthesis
LRGEDKLIFRVGIVGNHNPSKGHLLLLEAVSSLDLIRERIEIDIYGASTGAHTERIKRLVEKFGLVENVRFIHKSFSLSEIYDGLDCVVVPSSMEAFGRVPLEALSRGVPVIYSNSGGMGEYMTNGESGLAFEPGNSKDLAVKIALLVENVALRKAIGETGYNKTLARIKTVDHALLNYEIFIQSFETHSRKGKSFLTKRISFLKKFVLI